MSPKVEDRIIELRKSNPDWGARTIRNKLRKEFEEVPSLSSIHRCLVRHRLIDHKPRKRKPGDYKRWERSRAMELWQADVMGVPDLVEGVRLQLVTGECEVRGEDVGGLAVNIGARVASLAGSAEVLVSSTVKDLVIGSGIEFEDRGTHSLKGVPGDWRLYSVKG